MKTYIWGLPTRVFHSCLVLFIIIAWISADDDYLQIHSAFGYATGVLIVFRLTWGIIGPKYSHFRDFNFNIQKAIDFSKNVFTHNNKKYLGHNPAAALVLFSLLIVILLIVISGVLTLGAQESKGIFSSLGSTMFKDMELFEGIHEFLSNFMLLLIFMHLAGILTDRLLHKEDETTKSILSGYKRIQGINTKINIFQSSIAIVFLIFTVLALYYTFVSNTFLY